MVWGKWHKMTESILKYYVVLCLDPIFWSEKCLEPATAIMACSYCLKDVSNEAFSKKWKKWEKKQAESSKKYMDEIMKLLWGSCEVHIAALIMSPHGKAQNCRSPCWARLPWCAFSAASPKPRSTWENRTSQTWANISSFVILCFFLSEVPCSRNWITKPKGLSLFGF